MYPDPINPKSFPDLLQKVDYDPFGVMPNFPQHAPCIFATQQHMTRVREKLAAGDSLHAAWFQAILQRGKLNDPYDEPDLSNTGTPLLNAVSGLLVRAALAYALTDTYAFRSRAMTYVRVLENHLNGDALSGFEFGPIMNVSQAFDLLSMSGLSPEEEQAFHTVLKKFPDGLDRCNHLHCNNHNVYNVAARLSVGLALRDQQIIHDALYGCSRNNTWRYGLIHHLRHDMLADGMNWEGAMGYHMLVMNGLCLSAAMLERAGVDIWHRGFPSLKQSDGHDEHRGYGPKGMKHLQAGFDAMLYQAMPGGAYSVAHDQVLGNMSATDGWWPLFLAGWNAYRDERYAWLLHQSQALGMHLGYPACFAKGSGDLEFVSYDASSIPEGTSPYVADATIGLTGKYVNGCSLFPMNGNAILRAEPESEQSLAVHFYWGPHWAGHRSPAALHIDIQADAERVTMAPHIYKDSYADPRHLTWTRTSIAHNTLAVDQKSMFPYDFPTESIWEMDIWRDNISDGKLVGFQAEEQLKAVRAINENVYEGVLIDRAIALDSNTIVDVFRVTSENAHAFDLATHCLAMFEKPQHAQCTDLGTDRGYMHFHDAWIHPVCDGWAEMAFGNHGVNLKILSWLGSPGEGRTLVVAQDPPVDERTHMGEKHPAEDRTTLLMRTKGESALFITIWSRDAGLCASLVEGAASSDVVLETTGTSGTQRWTFPLEGNIRLA